MDLGDSEIHRDSRLLMAPILSSDTRPIEPMKSWLSTVASLAIRIKLAAFNPEVSKSPSFS